MMNYGRKNIPEKPLFLKLLPILLGFLSILLTIKIYITFKTFEWEQIEHNTVSKALNTESYISIGIRERVERLVNMALYWEKVKNPSYKIWEYEAKIHTNIYKDLLKILWMNTSLETKWSYMRPNFQPILDKEIESLLKSILPHNYKQLIKPDINRENTVHTWFTPGFFFVVVPMKSNDSLIGMFWVQDLFRNIWGNLSTYDGYSKEVYADNQIIYTDYHVYGEGYIRREPIRSVKFYLYGTPYKVDTWPSTIGLKNQQTGIPNIILLTGLLLSIMLSITTFYIQKARFYILQLEMLNHQLNKGIIHHQKEHLYDKLIILLLILIPCIWFFAILFFSQLPQQTKTIYYVISFKLLCYLFLTIIIYAKRQRVKHLLSYINIQNLKKLFRPTVGKLILFLSFMTCFYYFPIATSNLGNILFAYTFAGFLVINANKLSKTLICILIIISLCILYPKTSRHSEGDIGGYTIYYCNCIGKQWTTGHCCWFSWTKCIGLCRKIETKIIYWPRHK